MKKDFGKRQKEVKKQVDIFDTFKANLEAESALRKAILNLNAKAIALTELNARKKSKPVVLKDYLSTLLISQEELNKYFEAAQKKSVTQITIDEVEKE